MTFSFQTCSVDDANTDSGNTERWDAFVDTLILEPMAEIILGFAFYSLSGRILSSSGILSRLDTDVRFIV